MRIGLLGGSFNPAHGGHRAISLMAMRALGLDAVWWLVSPGNPLKPKSGMAPLAARLASARVQAPADVVMRLRRPGLMVSGAWGHARMRQWIFGGVTQTLLNEAPVALMLAH